jgi:MEMO1 family protein
MISNMESQANYPRLRNLDIFPSEISGQRVICLRDPLKITDKVILVPQEALFILSLLDGRHSVSDIQAEFMRRFGTLIYRENIQGLVDQLEENLLLESERFRVMEKRSLDEFKNNPVRPLAVIGGGDEGNRGKLQELIESYFVPPQGPGLATGKRGSQELVGAIAPHIDYQRGGFCYAWAHKAIQEFCDADLFVILGTAHTPMNKPFALTRKDFQTPWGPIRTDQEFLKDFQTHCDCDFYEDETVHRGEHSIELQVVFQRACWPPKKTFEIVPILCGSFHEAILNNASPFSVPGVREFMEGMRAAMAKSSKKICLLASADLAHVGRRFGDPDGPNRLSLQSLGEEDLRLLAKAEQIDAEGFHASICREKDRRRICGLPPIFTLLSLIRAREGKILKYDQAPDTISQSAVTFASMAFFA